MQIEENSLFRSFTKESGEQVTPSTFERSSINQNENLNQQLEPEVEEFDISYDVLSLTKMISGSSINQKENQKHVTDRFIPIRKSASSWTEKFNENPLGVKSKKTKRG